MTPTPPTSEPLTPPQLRYIAQFVEAYTARTPG
jgi:hypothetical protein